MTRPISRSSFLAGLAGLGTLSVLDPVHAQRGGLRATAFVTQAAIPRGLSERALVAFARGHQARVMAETTDGPLDQRRWLGNLVVQFSAPIDDLEYHVLFFDATDGARTFIDDMAIMVGDRAQRTFVQRLTLPRPRFRPNRRISGVITVRRQEVGRVQFDVRGEEAQRSGVVSFTDDDTRRREE